MPTINEEQVRPNRNDLSGSPLLNEQFLNKFILRRFIDEFWNSKNLDVADELFAPDATTPDFPALPPGPAGVKLIGGIFLASFPDLSIDIERTIAERDLVMGQFVELATHQGEFLGIPATGKLVQFGEIGINQVRNGRIITSWFQLDQLGILLQISPEIIQPAAPRFEQWVMQKVDRLYEVHPRGKKGLIEELTAKSFAKDGQSTLQHLRSMLESMQTQ